MKNHRSKISVHIWLTLFMTIFCYARPGVAQVSVVEQEVITQIQGKENKEKQTWYVQGSNFRLDSEMAGRNSSFIFNGRNLYACIRATDPKSSEKIVQDANDAAIKSKFLKGVCIPVPINVATSFLISPHNSVSSLDVTESVQLSVSVKNYSDSVDSKSKTGKIAGVVCEPKKRNFELTYFSHSAGQDVESSAVESYCNDDRINWRRGLWMQLSRMMLQQKSGRELRSLLQGQKISDMGIDLEKTASYTVTSNKKQLRSSVVTIKTTAIKDAKSDDKMFSLPLAYDIVSTTKERVKMAESKRSDDTETSKATTHESSDDEGIVPKVLRSFLGFPF